jgi:hypothetical protein
MNIEGYWKFVGMYQGLGEVLDTIDELMSEKDLDI